MRKRDTTAAGVLACTERFVALGLFAAVLATLLMVALNGLAPEGVNRTFPSSFWAWTTLYAVAVAVPLAVVAALLGRARLLAWLPRVLVVAAAAWLLVAALWLNREPASRLLALDGPARLRWLAPVGFALAVGGVAFSALVPFARRAPVRILAAVLAVVVGTTLYPTPLRLQAAAAAARVETDGKARERLLVIGLDAGDWKYMEPLIAQGALPNLARLRERGAWGPLATVVPTRSPLVWTTIATGQKADDHGIRRFKTTRFEGLYRDFGELRSPEGFTAEVFYAMLRRAGWIFDTTVTSADRRVPAYWTIASDFGVPLSLVNWWATWPAEPTLGATVSERIHFWRLRAKGQPTASERLTYPDHLYREIEPLLVSPDDVTFEQAREFLDVTPEEWTRMRGVTFRQHLLESEFPYIYAMFETDRRISHALIERSRKAGRVPDDLWVLFRIVDLACHTALHYSPLVEDHLDASPAELAKYGRMVTEAYRHADRAIGELIDDFGPGNVIVVSDHGFELGVGRNGQKRYVHNRAPAGIFIAAGPAIRPGRVEGLSIHEIFPLVLYLKDLPVAEDLAGRVPLEVVSETFAAGHPMMRIASYGKRDGSATEIDASASDELMLERLRALGYIQ